jgi:hypothetical protein
MQKCWAREPKNSCSHLRELEYTLVKALSFFNMFGSTVSPAAANVGGSLGGERRGCELSEL